MQTAAAYASGAVDFIFTPILPEVLRAKVSALVDLFVQAQALQRSVESITTLNVALRDSEVASPRRAAERRRRDRHRRRGRADRVVQPLRPPAVRLQRGRGRRPPARADRRARAIAPNSPMSRSRWAARRDVPAEPTETLGCRKDGSCFPMEMGLSQMQIGDGHVHDRLHARHLRPQGVHRGA